MNTAEIIKRSDSDIYTKNIKSSDVDLFNIVKQVCELTGCSYDVAATALFDCNYDIERAVDRIFENPQQKVGESDTISNAWKEVAKPKKKPIVPEIVQKESNLHSEIPYTINTQKSDFKDPVESNQRASRGSGRGRGRNVRSNGRVFENNIQNDGGMRSMSRGRGRRPTIRGASNRGRPKGSYNSDQSYGETAHFEAETDNYFAEEVDIPPRVTSEWLSDDGEPETNNNIESVVPLETLSINDTPNPVEIVAKCKSMDRVFGDYSRTKAPPPSTTVPTEAIKLMTSNGVICLPSRTNFNFGLDFAEYCDGNVSKISSTRVQEDYRKVHIDEDDVIRIQVSQDGFNRVSKGQIDDKIARKIQVEDNHSRRSESEVNVSGSRKTLVGDHLSKRTPPDVHEMPFVSSTTSHQSDISINEPSYRTAPQCMPENTFTTIMPPSTQLCAPPGISNAHLIQQIHNNQQYLSLMNLQPSIFDLADIAASSSNAENQALHSVESKDFISKPHTSKSVEQDHAAIVNAMQMSNLCCFPQMYMNNYGNFLPAVPGHNTSGHITTGQSVDMSQSNKALFTLPMHGNYGQEEFSESGKYDDVPGKMKYNRGQNYGNYVSKEEDEKTKIVGTNQQVNRQSMRSGQQTMSNDPRYLAFQHTGHPYPSNMYNCVTAPGNHPNAQHQYAMTHQAGGMAQLHLMQQQMHNFPQSYQYQEHLMTSMVSNANNRNSAGSNGNQARNSRSNNALWHPSN